MIQVPDSALGAVLRCLERRMDELKIRGKIYNIETSEDRPEYSEESTSFEETCYQSRSREILSSNARVQNSQEVK